MSITPDEKTPIQLLVEALIPVHDECTQKADFDHDSWNPERHIEITLTIAECRAIRKALLSVPWEKKA